jgi:phosphoglycerate dehydrogenase-like enzyme
MKLKTIALVGPYNAEQHESLYRNVPEGFRMFDVPTPKEYPLLKDADYLIIRTIRLKGDDLKEAKNLKLVHKWGVGYDNLDVPSISALNIPIAICQGVNAQPVAELVVLHILALYRHFLVLNQTIRQNIWAKDTYSSSAYILRDKKTGIIGLGDVGRKVAKFVQVFGATVQYYDKRRLSPERERELGVTFVPLEELLKTSDIVTVNVPLDDDTSGMIGAAQLKMMKKTALLINSARGEIVNEAALVDALRAGEIAGAGLDAFSEEPLVSQSTLFEMENVTLTPHTGGNTADNDIHMIRCLMDNIAAIDRGEDLGEKYIVNGHLLQSTNK